MSKIMVSLPAAVAVALGVGEPELETEVLRRVVVSLYTQNRINLEEALKLSGLRAGKFAALVFSPGLSASETDAEKRRDLKETVRKWGEIARRTGLRPEEIEQEVRAVRDLGGH